MQQTTYYQLSEQDYGENPDVALINGNMDVIDTALNKARIRDTDLYNENSTYAIGDFCIYNDAMYKCIGATTGAWDSTKWTQTSIAAAFEPRHTWVLYDTHEADGTTRIDRVNMPSKVNGVFVRIKLTAAATATEFGVVVKTTARHGLGDLANFIPASGVSYGIAKYIRDGNFYEGILTQRGGSLQNSPNVTERLDNFVLDTADIDYIEFRTNDTSAVIPSGSTFEIYIRR